MNTAEAFTKCISSAARSRTLDDGDIALLQGIVGAYPWLMTARILYNTATGVYDPLAELHYSTYRRPLQPLETISPEELGMAAVRENVGQKVAAVRESTAQEKPAVQESTPQETPVVRGNALQEEYPEEQPEENVIDKFLQKSEYRIVPDDSTPDGDEAASSGDFDPTDDFVSEELAEIYREQGLNRQAKSIYEKLSLLNPEKSIYFAEIIEALDRKAPHGK